MSWYHFEGKRLIVLQMIIWLNAITLPSISQAQNSALNLIEPPNSVYKEISELSTETLTGPIQEHPILSQPSSESDIMLADLMVRDNKLRTERYDQSSDFRSNEQVRSTPVISDEKEQVEVCAGADFTGMQLTGYVDHDLDRSARNKLDYCMEHELQNYRSIIVELIGSHVKLGHGALGTRDYTQARWHLNRVETLKQAYNVRSIDSQSLAEKISMMSKRQKPRIFGNF